MIYWTKSKRKKVLLCVLFSISLILLLIESNYLMMIHTEQQRKVIQLSSNEPRTVVFYRDDCSDCQKLFPKLYWHNRNHHDLVFVNLNAPGNRKYVHRYSIYAVPTFIKGTHAFVGTDLQKLNQVLKEK